MSGAAPLELQIRLPEWTESFLASVAAPAAALEARMQIAIALARANVEASTGGPFGAAVFERDSGVLVSVGVNRVVSEHCSAAHAEILALALAQRSASTYTLAQTARPLQLVSSAEPCAMCLGAIAWSGIAELVTGATDADVRAIGFDEGRKPRAWKAGLIADGIPVRTQVLRREAREVLELYRRTGGPVYNG